MAHPRVIPGIVRGFTFAGVFLNLKFQNILWLLQFPLFLYDRGFSEPLKYPLLNSPLQCDCIYIFNLNFLVFFLVIFIADLRVSFDNFRSSLVGTADSKTIFTINPGQYWTLFEYKNSINCFRDKLSYYGHWYYPRHSHILLDPICSCALMSYSE